MRKEIETETNSLSNKSLMRSHPVSGNSGLPIFLGRVLGRGRGKGAGLVEEGSICGVWAAATSAA